MPPYLASLYEVPLLTREQEVHLFRKFNFLKYKAEQASRASSIQRGPKSSVMDEIERLYESAVATKNQIVRANLRLVVSIAKRHVGPADNFFELVSDGNMSLIRAVEKFDFARGNKFSTYASWAIMKNFARTIPDEHRTAIGSARASRDVLEQPRTHRSDQYEQESAQAPATSADRARSSSGLTSASRRLSSAASAWITGHEPLTLKEVGAEMGVTKERIRQIEARALSKLRQAAEEEKIEVPGVA